jgi:hypothetical protein
VAVVPGPSPTPPVSTRAAGGVEVDRDVDVDRRRRRRSPAPRRRSGPGAGGVERDVGSGGAGGGQRAPGDARNRRQRDGVDVESQRPQRAARQRAPGGEVVEATRRRRDQRGGHRAQIVAAAVDGDRDGPRLELGADRDLDRPRAGDDHDALPAHGDLAGDGPAPGLQLGARAHRAARRRRHARHAAQAREIDVAQRQPQPPGRPPGPRPSAASSPLAAGAARTPAT